MGENLAGSATLPVAALGEEELVEIEPRICLPTPDLPSRSVIDDHTIRGYMHCPSSDGGWGRGAGGVTYTLFFYAQFSKPIAKCGAWEWDRLVPDERWLAAQPLRNRAIADSYSLLLRPTLNRLVAAQSA